MDILKRLIGTVLVLGLAFFVWFLFLAATDSTDGPHQDTTECPLSRVDINDEAQYMIIMPILAPDITTYKVSTDTKNIKENASAFTIKNSAALYGTTASGLIRLFKDCVQIDSTPFDDVLTLDIQYGTLQFETINVIQLDLLLGATVADQGPHHTTLRIRSDLYRRYAHETDVEKADARIYAAGSSELLENLPPPMQITGNIWEFIEHFTNYSGGQTRHTYYNAATNMLSASYLNVTATNNDIIADAVSVNSGEPGKNLALDTFDNTHNNVS